MKRLLLTLLLSTVAFAGDWELGIDANLTATLNSYSSGWVGEESGNFAWNTRWITFVNNQFNDRFRMENSLKLAFGQSANQKYDSIAQEYGKFDTFTVANDEIDFQNLEIITPSGIMEPYLGFRAQGTFFNQISENIEVKYLNPWSLTQSAGIRINPLKDAELQHLTSRLGVASKQHINRKVKTFVDGGFEWISNYDIVNKSGTLSYKTQLELFQAFAVSDEDIRGDKWKTIDLRWVNDFTANITNFIMVTYSVEPRYDRDVSEKLRVRQMLSAGFSFIKSNKKAE